MAVMNQTVGYCHNSLCRNVETVYYINNNYPKFPVVCTKCGFKTLYDRPLFTEKELYDIAKEIDQILEDGSE